MVGHGYTLPVGHACCRSWLLTPVHIVAILSCEEVAKNSINCIQYSETEKFHECRIFILLNRNYIRKNI